MKVCIACGQSKEQEEFYVHREMTDGRLSKCKECCKLAAAKRVERLMSDPTTAEAEKARHRNKYHRLGYREKHKASTEERKVITARYKAKYPEKIGGHAACAALPKRIGYDHHHWSYKEEHWTDILELLKVHHYILHRHIVYDRDLRLYRNSKGEILESKQSHIDLLESILQ